MSGMGRREFVVLLGGAAAWPLVARAQQADRMQRIGVLMASAAPQVPGFHGGAWLLEPALR